MKADWKLAVAALAAALGVMLAVRGCARAMSGPEQQFAQERLSANDKHYKKARSLLEEACRVDEKELEAWLKEHSSEESTDEVRQGVLFVIQRMRAASSWEMENAVFYGDELMKVVVRLKADNDATTGVVGLMLLRQGRSVLFYCVP